MTRLAAAAGIQFDTDQNGKLDLGEFVDLITSGLFKFRMNAEVPSSSNPRALPRGEHRTAPPPRVAFRCNATHR